MYEAGGGADTVPPIDLHTSVVLGIMNTVVRTEIVVLPMQGSSTTSVLQKKCDAAM